MLDRLRGRPARQDAALSSPIAPNNPSAVAVDTAARPKAAPVASVAAESKLLTTEEKTAMLPDNPVVLVEGQSMPFTRQELARIKKRFANALPAHSLSHVPLSVCAAMPELAGQSFALLALRYIATLHNSPRARQSIRTPRRRPPSNMQLTFDQFLAVLCLLSPKQSVTNKRQFLFLLYDADRDGGISVDDLVNTLSAVTTALSRAELRASATALVASVSPTTDTSTLPTLDGTAFQQLFTDADVIASLSIAL